MGYYASGSGYVVLKQDMLPDNVKRRLHEMFEGIYLFGDTVELSTEFEGYHGDDVRETLDVLSPYIVEGIIEYTGEDDSHWKHVFNNGFWEEVYGHIVYNDEYIVTRDRRAEFLGQIIDIFEDFLEEKGVNIKNPEKAEAVASGEDHESICILYGTDYGDLSNKLEEMMMNWRVMSVDI